MEIINLRKILLISVLLFPSLFCLSQCRNIERSSLIYLYVDKLPSFPSGKEGLRSFISKTLKWPDSEADVQGSVLLSFVITKKGNIESIKLEKSLLKQFDDEAIKVIKLMPKWNSGLLNGKKVNVKIYLPIDFFLK